MSPLKLNSFLTGVFLALFVAFGESAQAQDGLRLWKPYNPETFGGARHNNDGVYGSVSGIYWSFSTPNGGYIGATTTKGDDETRWVYDGSKRYAQTNSVKINMMDPSMSLGTRFELGNRRGHHGWLLSGYGLPKQTHRMSIQNMTMAIRDEGNFTFQPFAMGNISLGTSGGMELANTIYIWDRGHNSLYDPTATESGNSHYPFADWQVIDGTSAGTIKGIGYLWGYFGHIGAVTAAPDPNDPDNEEGDTTPAVALNDVGVFAPLPIWFKDSDITVSTSHRSAELMYTYRAHPFTWGNMELMAGVRYWDFNDSFKFYGSGPGGAATVVDDPDTEEDEGATVVVTPGASGNNVDTNYGPISILADMTINAQGINRVFGPQFGIKFSRQNARWTFGAEGRFTAGINAQSVKTEGYIATNYDYNTNYNYQNGGASMGKPVWVPVGLQYNNTNFGHKQNKTYFSPILELRLSADWQWTNAVSFFGAFDTMYAGNIARGVRITDYVVHSDGTIFGIRGNDRNTNVMVYGIEAGIKIKR